MTAIGTVSAVYRAVVAARPERCRLADTCPVSHWVVAAVAAPDIIGRQAGGRAGARRQLGATRDGGSGGSADSSPGVRPRGDGPGVAAARDGTTMRNARASRPAPSCASTCSAASRSGRRRRGGPPRRAATPGAVRPARARAPTAHRARRSPPTCGRTPMAPRPARCARRSGSSATASPTAGVDPEPSSTSTPSGRDPRRRRGSSSTSSRSRRASRTAAAARRRPSSSTAATSSRASATTASRPSASDSPTATRTPSSTSPSAGWRPATCDGARARGRAVLARDPLREEAHAVLIAVHGLIGSRSQVVRQYRRLQDVLARELGEPPLPETDAAYRWHAPTPSALDWNGPH